MYSNTSYPIPQNLQTRHSQPVMPEAIIELKSKYFSKIRKLIDDNERILYAGMIEKINQDGVEQQRIIIITSQHVYNVDPNDGFFAKLSMCSTSGMVVKRKIKVPKIIGVTVSVNQTSLKQQFVIHVRDGHDYRYNGSFSREKILRSLLTAHFCHTIEPLLLHCKEEADLKEYQTTESDASNKKTRRPKEVPIFVGPELAANGINWILVNRFQVLANHSRPVQQVLPVQSVRPTGFSSQPNYPIQLSPTNSNRNTYQPVFQSANNNNNGTQNGGYMKPQLYVPEMTQQQGNFQAPVQQGNYQAPVQQQQGQHYAQPSFPQQRPSETNNEFEKLLGHNGNPNYNVQINTFAPPK